MPIAATDPFPQEKSNLLVVHGEKGGVGKSFLASLAASRALRLGLPIHVIETDSGVPDVGPRFVGRPFCEVSAISLDRAASVGETLSDLLGGIEAMLSAPQPPALIVVNSPAGASEVLDAYAEIFASIADALAIDLTVGFVVDNSSAVLPRIESSMKTGLLSIKTARRSLIYAGWLGPIENFPIAKSDTRRAALASGLVELQFPALVSPFLDLVRKTQAPFYELTNSPGLKLVDRSFISRWLNQCEPVSDFLVGVEND